MLLRRFSAAFRTASINNTCRWLQSVRLQNIRKEKQMWWNHFKVKLPENLKNSYFPKRFLRVSVPFGIRVTFVFPQEYRKVRISVEKKLSRIEIAYLSLSWHLKILILIITWRYNTLYLHDYNQRQQSTW